MGLFSPPLKLLPQFQRFQYLQVGSPALSQGVISGLPTFKVTRQPRPAGIRSVGRDAR
jgi:hypothetical protein